MTYAFDDLSLSDAIDQWVVRARSHTFREAELDDLAGRLAGRALKVAALGQELPSREHLDTLRCALPRPGREDWRRRSTVLARSVFAMAAGAPISPYVTAGTPAPDRTVDTSTPADDLRRRLVSPDSLPPVAAPGDELPYPVLVTDDAQLSWDIGDCRFNRTTAANSRLRNLNLLLLTRGLGLSFPDLVREFCPLLEDSKSEYAGMINGYNTLAERTPFVQRTKRGLLPAVDPRAVFIDTREL